MDSLLTIGEAGKMLGVSIFTLRRWEREGKLVPVRTAGNQRRYPLSVVSPSLVRTVETDRKTVAYARVSSHDQQADLNRQAALLVQYCAAHKKSMDVLREAGVALQET